MDEYINLLANEVKERSEVQSVLKTHGTPPLDANFRLNLGYINCLVRVIKDLSAINNTPVEETFYPDLPGFLEIENEQ